MILLITMVTETCINGSLVADANKSIALIEYDNFNHPRRLQFTNGNVTEYVYTSDGRKLSTIHTTAVSGLSVPIGSKLLLTTSTYVSTDTTEYFGNYIFENGSVSRYLFDGGYCSYAASQTAPALYFFTTDHLGNVRAVCDEAGVIRQINHYYPFGGIYADAAYNDDLQKQKYNGKELDRMHGLNFYDYGARHYDPILSQFTQVDPMAEIYYHLSPYAYCANNPINAIDPDGKIGVLIHGTWSNNDTWRDVTELQNAIDNLFNDGNIKFAFKWSGGNYRSMRTDSEMNQKYTNENVTLQFIRKNPDGE